jgi:small subunit ribosomal protein S15
MLRIGHLAERVCIASTSRAVTTATRSSGTSAAAPPSRQKRQQQLKKVKEKHEFSLRIQELTKPDPYLGHQDNEEGHKYWQSSELYKVILTKDAIWGVREDRRGNLVKIENDTSSAASETEDNVESRLGPERMNFGLDSPEIRQMLFQDLPSISQEDVMKYQQDPSMADQNLIDKIEESQWKGEKGVDVLSRVLDLKNASGKGIQVENTRRIINHFGGREPGDERGPDTGSVEVQGEMMIFRRYSSVILLTCLNLSSRCVDLSDSQPT